MAERSHSTGSWLDQLGRESWHLELLISGISIFLLIQGSARVEEQITLFLNHTQFHHSIVLTAVQSYLQYLKVGMSALIVNLILHMVMRGLWIGAIGLRSVNHRTDFMALGYTSFFRKVLRKNTPSLDAYIRILDKYCSSVFAFSFLIVFVALCIGLYMGLVTIYFNVFTLLMGAKHTMAATYVAALVYMMILILTIVYIVDFAFLGPLKKVDGLDRIYYPFYKFLSWISLSFLYRSLYYTMIGRRFSRRFVVFIIPYFLIIILGNQVRVRTQPFIPKTSGPEAIHPEYYDDMRRENRVELASVPSRVVREGWLDVFVPITLSTLEPKIRKYCPDLEPLYDQQVHLVFIKGDADWTTIGSAADIRPYLDCFDRLLSISVDGREMPATPYICEHPMTTQYGLLYPLDLDTLARGVHVIGVGRIDSRSSGGRDSVYYRPYAVFPVWKL